MCVELNHTYSAERALSLLMLYLVFGNMFERDLINAFNPFFGHGLFKLPIFIQIHRLIIHSGNKSVWGDFELHDCICSLKYLPSDIFLITHTHTI